MKKLESVLFPGEYIKTKIAGTFEVKEKTGIEYKFGEFLATNKRLIWYTKYPFAHEEVEIHNYSEISRVDIDYSFFTFNSGVSMKIKWASHGDRQFFFENLNELIH
ncbi:PH domain-containing protein [Ornithinibacillus bavariensis]|uniref:YokE-like PH domain-containing protein n=1 Tax=Ornithinibacillus bavariensis TaxID=545502 RepID=A0A920C4A7_9BACI|nr:PH domain-containing protein [Ornithinibacillus bavariensis]GIO25511.1 hypothetical protein J43TS3_01220 [Ornithinibacillus bavariensis]HAM80614.1 hypothetical protein [Ornithinibacillus sp.]